MNYKKKTENQLIARFAILRRQVADLKKLGKVGSDILAFAMHTESELDQIFNTAAEGMRVIDRDFNVIRVNDTFSKLLEVSRDEVLRKKCYEVFPGALCHGASCPLTRILSGEDRIEEEVEKDLPDGSKIPYLLTATPFRGPEGTVIGIVEHFKDLFSLKQTEQSLRKNEETLGAILNAVGDQIRMMDRDLTVIWANGSARTVFGNEIVGKKCYEASHVKNGSLDPDT